VIDNCEISRNGVGRNGGLVGAEENFKKGSELGMELEYIIPYSFLLTMSGRADQSIKMLSQACWW